MLTPQLRVQQDWHRETCLPDDQKVSKPCSEASILKEIGNVENTHNFEIWKHPDRGWIRSNTKLGQVKLYAHEGR